MLRVATLRSRAIDAALRMVEARGAENVNLRDLAADLGTGPASLYYHFANEDALMRNWRRRDFAKCAWRLWRRCPIPAADAHCTLAATPT